MPRIDAPNPSAQAASTSSRRAETDPGSSTVRHRASTRHDTPQGLAQRAHAPADQQQAAQPARARAGLQALRQTAQAAADGSAGIVRAGARLGVAAGAAFLASPVRTTGMGMLVCGGSYSLLNRQLDNELETLRGVAVASAGYGLMTASKLAELLPGAVQGVVQAIQAVAGALQAAADAAAAAGRTPQISQQLAFDALDMVFVIGDPDPSDPEDLSEEVGRHAPQVIDHLADLRTGAASETVQAAVIAANGDPAQLVRNLHALVIADPPVLSSRPNSQGARAH